MQGTTARDPVNRRRDDDGRLAFHAADRRHAAPRDPKTRLEVRLARDQSHIAAFQALRYRLFSEEMSAVADARVAAPGRDFDDFDGIRDHLLVVDHGHRRRRGAVSGAGLSRALYPHRGEWGLLHGRLTQRIAVLPSESVEISRVCD